MKYVIVSCSQRQHSQSIKVARYLEKQLDENGHEVFLHDCGIEPLPLWGTDSGDSAWTYWQQVSEALLSAEAFVLVTPEWCGMATPQSKNLFLLAGQKELGHKAGMIVSVSAGRGGAYPIAELRSSSYKNSRINWIPEHVIVRQVETVLNDEVSESISDTWIRDRIDFALTHLEIYAEALGQVRTKLPTDPRFGNGM